MLKAVLIIVCLHLCIGWNYFKIKKNKIALPKFEHYYAEDLQYLFFSDEVVWLEAVFICQAFNGHLAELNTLTKLEKNSERLEDVMLDPQQIWIGGFMYNNYTWKWVKSSLLIDSVLLTIGHWFRRPVNIYKKCLAIDRRYSDILFIDLSCQSRKPFLCETPINNHVQISPLESQCSISVDINTFVLYYEKMTWTDAVGYCYYMGLQLATLHNENETKRIAFAMLQGRPSLQEIWVSGYFDSISWKWLPTLKPLQWNLYQHSIFKNFNLSVVNKCILFNRHYVNNEHVFIPTKCNIKKPFLCETKTTTTLSKTYTVAIGKFNFSLIAKELSWLHAQKHCTTNGGYLAELIQDQDIKDLTILLENQPEEANSIWLGGIYKNGKWIWAKSEKLIQTDRINFYNANYDNLETLCLNLDTAEMKMYSLKCDFKQFFVCITHK